MTYIVSGILVFANFISTLLKGRGKLFFYMLLILMWVLFWGSYDNADYLNYKTLYDYVSSTGMGYPTSQFGFVIMMKLVSSLGLEYHHFLMILSFVGMYLITNTVKKYTNKPQLVYLLYFIHPFLLDVVQVKHFFAMSIIIYCFRYLEQDGTKNNIKYILGILIAFSIHSISIIFLPLLFIKKMKISRLYLIVIMVLTIGVPLAYTNVFQIIASKFVPFQRIAIYFDNRAKYGFLVQCFIQSIIFLMVYYSKLILEKRKESNKYVELIYRINLYLIMLFPLYIINGTFERAFRIIMIPNYIVFSKLYSSSKKSEKVVILVGIFMFVIALFFRYTFIYRDTVFYPIFEKNLLFK